MSLRSIHGVESPEQLSEALRTALYLADDGIATAAFLALALGKPLLLEGAPGVGKTEAAKALAGILGRRLIRLQCFEGIDAAAALYEWNYPRQMLAIRQAREGETLDIYRDDFLIERPMLTALRHPQSTLLLIDEIDRSDHEFEAFLLEFLSDFSISIPERGTLRAAERPIVLLTSNRTRELHEALRRRCIYHYIAYPDAEREARIIHGPGLGRGGGDGARHRPCGGGSGASPWRSRPASPRRSTGRKPPPRSPAPARPGRRRSAVDRSRPQGRGGPRPHAPRLNDLVRRDCGMSALPLSPRSARRRPLVAFPQLLRRHGFAAAPEQTFAFLQAIDLLGPRSLWHLRQAAIATLAPPPDRRDLFDALFDAHFLGASLPADIEDFGPDAEMQTQDDGIEQEILIGDEVNETGQEATTAEALAVRRLQPPDESDALRRLGVRCRPRCRSGAATAAGARGAGRASISPAACARRCAMTAKS